LAVRYEVRFTVAAADSGRATKAFEGTDGAVVRALQAHGVSARGLPSTADYAEPKAEGVRTFMVIAYAHGDVDLESVFRGAFAQVSIDIEGFSATPTE
jgi:hypothetical protein